MRKRVISKTPLRVSLFGGGTDYPLYYERSPGATLGFTINQYVYVSVNELSPFFDYNFRVSYSKIEFVRELVEIAHPAVRGVLLHKGVTTPLDIHVTADLPAKTGLGSSSAFTVGLVRALDALAGEKVSKMRLAQEACHIEQKVLQERVGSQDQFHAAYGGINVLEFGKDKIRVRPVALSLERQALLESQFLMFYTGLTRFAHEVVEEQLEKTKAASNDAYLGQLYDMVFEAEEILLQAPNSSLVSRLGGLLDRGWELKKKLSSKITNPQVDAYYAAAREAGALGGKLCGAGSGGFLVFFAKVEDHANIRRALQGLPEVPVAIEKRGSRVIYRSL